MCLASPSGPLSQHSKEPLLHLRKLRPQIASDSPKSTSVVAGGHGGHTQVRLDGVLAWLAFLTGSTELSVSGSWKQ